MWFAKQALAIELCPQPYFDLGLRVFVLLRFHWVAQVGLDLLCLLSKLE